MDSNSRTAYINKLREQQKLTNPIIGRLQGAIDFLKISDKTAWVLACMQAKIHSMHKRIKTRIATVQTTHEEEGLLFSLDQIKADIQLLNNVIPEASQELDIMYEDVIQHELTQGDVETLLEQTTNMMDSAQENISRLRGRLMNAVATINKEE